MLGSRRLGELAGGALDAGAEEDVVIWVVVQTSVVGGGGDVVAAVGHAEVGEEEWRRKKDENGQQERYRQERNGVKEEEDGTAAEDEEEEDLEKEEEKNQRRARFETWIVCVYQDDGILLEEQIVSPSLTLGRHHASRRERIQSLEAIGEVKAEDASKPTDRRPLQCWKLAEESDEGEERDDEDSHGNLPECPHIHIAGLELGCCR